MDAERAHSVALRAGKLAQRFPSRSKVHGTLKVGELSFSNRLGIAAGLDKNGELLPLWERLGLGFAEIGSVTLQPSAGNPRPRAFRLPADQAVVNRMGLNNHGVHVVSERIRQFKKSSTFPVGLSVAKTHDPTLIGDAGLADIVECFTQAAVSSSDYIAVNISCPNTKEGKTFEEPAILKELLNGLSLEKVVTPVFVKVSPDVRPEKLTKVVSVCMDAGIDGFIACNTSNDRSGLASSQEELERIGRGGLSGAPLFPKAITVVSQLRSLIGPDIPVMGVGGINSPQRAKEMRNSGADLLQMYTGMIYEGPGLVKRIIAVLS